jgi:hypothetical protein
MKLEDLKSGIRILIPCAQCGHKRSLEFKSIGQYQRDKERCCYLCAAEDREPQAGRRASLHTPLTQQDY